MSDPTFTDPPTPTPDKTQSNSAFSAAVTAFLAWLITFVSEMTASITWMRARVSEVTASAILLGTLPDMTGKAGYALAVNGDEDAPTLIPSQNVGNCRLTYVDTDEIALMPENGNSVKAAGVLHEIPAAGISMDNSGLSAATLYYVYFNGVTEALVASATGHSTDTTAGNVGVEIMTGDNTKTLVGMVYLIDNGGTPEFHDSETNRLVLSWFNRETKLINASYTGAALTTASTTPVSLGSTFDVSFLKWGSGKIHGEVRGIGDAAVAAYGAGLGSVCDTVNAANVICEAYGISAGPNNWINLNGSGWSKASYAEGHHTAHLMGFGNAATASFAYANNSLGHSLEVEG